MCTGGHIATWLPLFLAPVHLKTKIISLSEGYTELIVSSARLRGIGRFKGKSDL